MGQSDTQTPGNVFKQFKDCDENKTTPKQRENIL